jgi:hypothetical protein
VYTYIGEATVDSSKFYSSGVTDNSFYLYFFQLWISFEATLCELYNSLKLLTYYFSSCYRLSHFHVDLLASGLSLKPLVTMTATPLFVATSLNCARILPNRVYNSELLTWVESNYSIPSQKCSFFLEFSLLGCFISTTYFELFKKYSKQFFFDGLGNEFFTYPATKTSCISHGSQDSSIDLSLPGLTEQNTNTLQHNCSASFQSRNDSKASFNKKFLQSEINDCQQLSASGFNSKKKFPCKKKIVLNSFPMIYISMQMSDEHETENEKAEKVNGMREFCSSTELHQPEVFANTSDNKINDCMFDWSPLTFLKIPIVPAICSFPELSFSTFTSQLFLNERKPCNVSTRKVQPSLGNETVIGASTSCVSDFSILSNGKNSCYLDDASRKNNNDCSLVVYPPRNTLFRFSFMKHKSQSINRKSKSTNFGFSALHSQKLSSHWKRLNTNLLKPSKTNFSKRFQLASMNISEDMNDLINSESESNFSQIYLNTVLFDHNHEGNLEGTTETIMKTVSTPSSNRSLRTNFSIGASSESSILVNRPYSIVHKKETPLVLKKCITIIADIGNVDNKVSENAPFLFVILEDNDESKQIFREDTNFCKQSDNLSEFSGIRNILEIILLQTPKHDINVYEENKDSDIFVDIGQNFKLQIHFFSWFPSHLSIDYFVLKFICREDKRRQGTSRLCFAKNMKGTLQHSQFPFCTFNVAQTSIVETEPTVAFYLILYPNGYLKLHSGYSKLLITGKATTVGNFFLTDLYTVTGECILEHSFTTKPPYNNVRDLALCRLHHKSKICMPY